MKEYFRPAPTRDPIDIDQYGGKWIAIWRRRIVDADPELHALVGRIDRRGIGEKATLFHVIESGLIIG